MDPIPDNVLRPTDEQWQEAWGKMEVPPGNGGTSLEIGQLMGTGGIGACIRVLPPGNTGVPLHYHYFEEELFFVLDGELTVRELAPDAQRYTEYTLHTGELVAYPPGTCIAHQSINRGTKEARYLGLSNGWVTDEVGVYPDSGKTLVRGIDALGVFAEANAAPAHIAAARAAAEARGVDVLALDARPAWVQGPTTLTERHLGGGVHGTPLARSAGATKVFVNRDRLTPGAKSSPLHWHTADEELLLVLQGSPTLRQLENGEEQRLALQPGDVVCWKPKDEIAHQLIDEGEADAVVLVIGTDCPEDVTVFPEQERVFVRALGRSGEMQKTGYWAGEGA